MKTESEIRELLLADVDALFKLCRICLSVNSDNLTSLFDHKEDENLYVKMRLCCGVQVQINDQLPPAICPQCFQELTQADNFRRKCLEADCLLKNAIFCKQEDDFDQIDDKPLISMIKVKEELVEPSTSHWICGQVEDFDQSIGIKELLLEEVALENIKVDDDSVVHQFEQFDDVYINKKPKKLKKYACPNCSNKFSGKTKLNTHIRKEHEMKVKKQFHEEEGDNNNATVGDNCKIENEKDNFEGKLKKKRGRKEDMNFNGSIIVVDNEKRYKCLECDYHTPYKHGLNYHVRTHTGEKPHVCEVCKRSFAQPASLMSHRKIHSDEMYFTCPVCGRQFKYKQKLDRHKLVHSTEKKFICTICSKGLKSKISLSIHMKRHNNVRNYSCETCGAAFVTSSDLINHSKIHNINTRKYACHICKFRSYKKSGLDKHLKYHSGERPFSCDVCQMAYYSKGELTFHMRQHTKEKRYVCSLCNQAFGYSPSLNKHMLRAHGIKFKWAQVVDRRIVK